MRILLRLVTLFRLVRYRSLLLRLGRSPSLSRKLDLLLVVWLLLPLILLARIFVMPCRRRGCVLPLGLLVRGAFLRVILLLNPGLFLNVTLWRLLVMLILRRMELLSLWVLRWHMLWNMGVGNIRSGLRQAPRPRLRLLLRRPLVYNLAFSARYLMVLIGLVRLRGDLSRLVLPLLVLMVNIMIGPYCFTLGRLAHWSRCRPRLIVRAFCLLVTFLPLIIFPSLSPQVPCRWLTRRWIPRRSSCMLLNTYRRRAPRVTIVRTVLFRTTRDL